MQASDFQIDSVRMMRDIRAQLDCEICDLNHEQILAYIHGLAGENDSQPFPERDSATG
ncbi:hypothetical protein [Longimicrobium terrae]|uniref:Uncharacterized protein n=1 Tax=Longimicrobium terrae TaxID=1639882 RepID=A0A841H4H8_9BACT|nr:hypothetical protein [Longimicrobium terrae]MBB4638638.1 hypothetical protein [Longimicrobium terrae]MBB6072878.1 hypothetical protein [Longimicrobium terrae]NNC31493.1 hypothetical protein [Longimicrobium terrae]